LQQARIHPAQQKRGVKAPPQQARHAAEQQMTILNIATTPAIVARKISKASKAAITRVDRGAGEVALGRRWSAGIAPIRERKE